jgi:hypothetical protein
MELEKQAMSGTPTAAADADWPKVPSGELIRQQNED